MKQSKILVVEDDVDIQQILSVFLEHSDFEVRTASDGQEAINIIPNFCPHLIVLDLVMRPVSGWEVLRWLQANRQASSTEAYAAEGPIPVLVLTALTHIAEQIHGFEAGAVEYITKPTQPSKIVERISTILSLSVEQRTMLQRKRMEEQRDVLERIYAPQPDEFLY